MFPESFGGWALAVATLGLAGLVAVALVCVALGDAKRREDQAVKALVTFFGACALFMAGLLIPYLGLGLAVAFALGFVASFAMVGAIRMAIDLLLWESRMSEAEK